MKLLGAVLVIVSCGAIGFHFAANLRKEILLIQALIDILNYMECELNYRLTPLPQLCRQSVQQDSPLCKLFIGFADELDKQICPNTASCMEAVLAKYENIPGSVSQLLWELSKSFGTFDLQGQLAGINAVRKKCVRHMEEMEMNKDLRIRNYQSLGLCAGVAIAILLI